MTDSELDKAIAELIYPRNGWAIYRHNSDRDKDLYIRYEETRHYEKISYCNDWNKLMPLVDEYKISLMNRSVDNKWIAFNRFKNPSTIRIEALNVDSQRAAAECLLKVLIEKKANNDEA